MPSEEFPVVPIQCIVPPHMVEAIKMRGTPAQQGMARAMEQQAEHYRTERVTQAPAASFRAAPTLAAEAKAAPRRRVHDCEGGTALPGRVAREEDDDATGDRQVDEAYDGAGDTWQLYYQEYRRDSLDGRGMPLVSCVHYGRDYNNAFWDGSQMVYGDGDGVVFTSLTGDLAVIGHELSHGVVQFSGGLVYRDQSGALNEHVADVFGVLARQHRMGLDAAEDDWLIGAGVLGPDIRGKALRSMAEPGTAYDDDLLGKDPQPYHMDGYVQTGSDNGGVHINSGIPNHAFYLLAVMLGGKAWLRAGHIWYQALQAINNPLATFADWADETVEQARSLYGAGGREALLARRVWKLVGVW